MFYAHSLPDHPKSHWEPLFTPFGEVESDKPALACSGKNAQYCPHCETLHPQHGHLNKVAYLCAKFASSMFTDNREQQEFAKQWGYLAGLWHDLGKFSQRFQNRLSGENLRVDHATKGAQELAKLNFPWGHLLAYGVAGHHSGLLDAESNFSCQKKRLTSKTLEEIPSAPSFLLTFELPPPPKSLFEGLRSHSHLPFHTSLLSRFFFSCLIDADFLATEAFMNAGQTRERNQIPENCLEKIAKLVRSKIDNFPTPAPTDTVNLQRAKVVTDCRRAAESEPGLFTLTVPTGGGKTLSSLQFALDHALKYQKKRIIYVIPFTSIIEQNAEVIRDILAPLETEHFQPLIEHHSSLSPEKDSTTSRLATENWDAPIIITTAVQFYESFFAAKTSRSRKIHNVANSVVIFDEAQSLPVNFLTPCLSLLRELSDFYATTCVLCTATQPAIEYEEENFNIGLTDLREIIEDTDQLFSTLKRVELSRLGQRTNSDLSTQLNSHRQALCIVNRRKHAQELYELLPESEENFHLSALMCPEHRSRILQHIRQRLEEDLPTRVISTQLIEAGVDVDFPVVYRALAGLDSIAQAAGRCNRHGKLKSLGQVFLFEADDQQAETYFRDTAQVTQRILPDHPDLLSTTAIQDYFDRYYYKNSSRWDEKGIMELFECRGKNKTLPFHFQFQTAAKEFQLIAQWQQPVLIPYDNKAKKLIEELRNPNIPLHRQLLRGLQRYTVQVPPKLLTNNWQDFEHLRDDEFHVLISPELHYSTDFGLHSDPNSQHLTSLIL